jgi:hypothetical protein
MGPAKGSKTIYLDEPAQAKSARADPTGQSGPARFEGCAKTSAEALHSPEAAARYRKRRAERADSSVRVLTDSARATPGRRIWRLTGNGRAKAGRCAPRPER